MKLLDRLDRRILARIVAPTSLPTTISWAWPDKKARDDAIIIIIALNVGAFGRDLVTSVSSSVPLFTAIVLPLKSAGPFTSTRAVP